MKDQHNYKVKVADKQQIEPISKVNFIKIFHADVFHCQFLIKIQGKVTWKDWCAIWYKKVILSVGFDWRSDSENLVAWRLKCVAVYKKLHTLWAEWRNKNMILLHSLKCSSCCYENVAILDVEFYCKVYCYLKKIYPWIIFSLWYKMRKVFTISLRLQNMKLWFQVVITLFRRSWQTRRLTYVPTNIGENNFCSSLLNILVCVSTETITNRRRLLQASIQTEFTE